MDKNEIAVVEKLPVITERLEEVSKDIQERTKRAMSLVVSEENYKEIKKIRAEFNKEFAYYEDLRKNIKKMIMSKYDEFEERYNTLIGNAFKNAENEFKAKISEQEYNIIAKKENELKFYFHEYATSLHIENIITWEKLNIKVKLSDSENKLRQQIKDKLDSIAKDLEIIRLEGEYANDIMLEYLKSFDYTMSKLIVLQRNKDKEMLEREQQKRDESLQQEQEIERKVDEEITIPVETVDNSVEILTTIFEVSGTIEQLSSLKQFMVQNNIKFNSIKGGENNVD